MRRGVVIGLLALGLLPIVGRFLPPTLAWGFHHAAYLPVWAWACLLVAWALLLLPPFHRAVDRIGCSTLCPWLFGTSVIRPLLAAALFTAVFVLLRNPVHFLGDGVLVGELVGRGAPFRAHDAMDYLLHVQIHKALGNVGNNAASFRLYAIGSWIAGFFAVLLALALLRHSRLPQASKGLVFALWILSAPTLLYCGYVESYGFVSVAMLGFLWSGAMAQRGEAPPWLPGLLYGTALFFHSTALIGLPAFLWLAFFPGPDGISRKNWTLRVLAPAVVMPVLALLSHAAAGYSEAWFNKEFRQSQNMQQLLVTLGGSHGLLSFLYWKDLANWLLLVLPVSGWLVLARSASLVRSRFRQPDIAFLLIQCGAFLIAFLLLDRKIGAARDWDLLTPQIAGFAWLAARLAEAGSREGEQTGFLPSVRVAAPWVALLFVVPWLAVNASTERSILRFDEIRTDFPRRQRAYAAEELGKYHRDNGDYKRSLGYYEESVETYPRNARTRVLLGTNYLMLERIEDAIAQYDTALAIDPDFTLALDMKGKIALAHKNYAAALPLYREFATRQPANPDAWSGLGSSSFALGQYEQALRAFLRAGRLRADWKFYYYGGLSAGYLDRWEDAIRLLSAAARLQPDRPEVVYALGAAHEARATTLRADGQPGGDDLQKALDYVGRACRLDAENEKYRDHLDRLRRLMGGAKE
jgi:tetratricopeptide (TPR) repeat protein